MALAVGTFCWKGVGNNPMQKQLLGLAGSDVVTLIYRFALYMNAVTLLSNIWLVLDTISFSPLFFLCEALFCFVFLR